MCQWSIRSTDARSYLPEFIKILKYALQDVPYTVKDEAVCVECKANENECMYEKRDYMPGAGNKGGLQFLVHQQREHMLRMPRHG